MKKTLIITTLILVLGLTMVVQGQKESGGWEYAKVQVAPFQATAGSNAVWIWKEPTVNVEGEDLIDLCRQLKINVPYGEEPDFYTVINWAGSNGWELVLFNYQDVNSTSAWFKRKS